MTTLKEIGRLAKKRTDEACDLEKHAPRYSKRHHKDMAAILNKAKAGIRRVSKDHVGEGRRITNTRLYIVDAIAYDIVKLFEADNPRFDKERFFEAVNEGEVK